MADVFLSYARKDRPIAERLAGRLEAAGWMVWWDFKVRVGARFDQTIDNEIAAARAVIVIWSRVSVKRQWVHDEAAEAMEHNKLLPVRIDDARIPFRFRRLQTADLTAWAAGESPQQLEILIKDLKFMLGARARAKKPEFVWTAESGEEYDAFGIVEIGDRVTILRSPRRLAQEDESTEILERGLVIRRR